MLKYNNSLFSTQGKLNRLFYILHNAFWNILGFRFVYYPAIIKELQSSSMFTLLTNAFSSNPNLAWIVPYLTAKPEHVLLYTIIGYLFLIPLRLVDIKRMRDILNRELSIIEQGALAVLFSLPYMDFLSTFFLSIIKPNKYAKSKIEKEIKKVDLNTAQIEATHLRNKRLFESGKISRAEYLKTIEKK